MRVRVDEAGHDHAAGGVQHRLFGMEAAQVAGGSDCGDLPGTDEYRAVFEDAKVAKGVSALRAACEGQELGSGVN